MQSEKKFRRRYGLVDQKSLCNTLDLVNRYHLYSHLDITQRVIGFVENLSQRKTTLA